MTIDAEIFQYAMNEMWQDFAVYKALKNSIIFVYRSRVGVDKSEFKYLFTDNCKDEDRAVENALKAFIRKAKRAEGFQPVQLDLYIDSDLYIKTYNQMISESTEVIEKRLEQFTDEIREKSQNLSKLTGSTMHNYSFRDKKTISEEVECFYNACEYAVDKIQESINLVSIPEPGDDDY